MKHRTIVFVISLLLALLCTVPAGAAPDPEPSPPSQDGPATSDAVRDANHTAAVNDAPGVPVSIEVWVSDSTDDAEERISDGDVARKGVDLELGEDSVPQVVGLRFLGVDIRPGANITGAYLEFSADETHDGPTNLSICGQATADPPTFSAGAYDVSSRPTTSACVDWNSVPPWNTVHDKYQSPDISPVIQEIVNRPGWASDKSLVLLVTGSGRRTAESFNGAEGHGDLSLAPLLHVDYNTTPPVCYTLTSNANPPAGGAVAADPAPNCGGDKYHEGTQVQLTANPNACYALDNWSGDLSGSDNPATITMNADKNVTANFHQPNFDLQVHTDGDGSVALAPDQASHACGTSVQLTANPGADCVFSHWSGDLSGSDNPANLDMDSHKEVTAHFGCGIGPLVVVYHSIDDDNIGQSSGNEDNIVDCGETIEMWIRLENQGALAATNVEARCDGADAYLSFIEDTVSSAEVPAGGTAEPGPFVFSVDASTPHRHVIAFDLNITADNGGPWTDSFDIDVTCQGPSDTIDVRVSDPNDDAEETLSNGSVARHGWDLELGEDRDAQAVGLRFQNITIPQGATITSAVIEFTADEAHDGDTDLVFHGQAADNAPPFADTEGDISDRPVTGASVAWNNVPAWNVIHDTHQSVDLATIIQEIVDRGGWASGNSLVIVVTGSGKRVAEAYDGEATMAPKLHGTYAGP